MPKDDERELDDGLEANSVTRDENDDDEEIHPFLNVTGLDFNCWPAWAPFPSKGVFMPYFSVQVSSNEKKPSFLTTVSLSEMVFACGQLARVLKVSTDAMRGMGATKAAVFTSKENLIEEIESIRADLGFMLTEIKENDVITDISEVSPT